MKLVISDLDGTLVDKDAQASAATLEAIAGLFGLGIPVVACTARSARSAVPLSRELGINRGHVICGSGSSVYDLEADKVVMRELLPGENAIELVTRLRSLVPGIAFSAEKEEQYFREEHYVSTLVPMIEATIQDALKFVTEAALTKINVRHPQLDDAELFAAVDQVASEAGLSYVISAAGFVEVLGPGINKSTGSAWVAERLGTEASDVIAYGDDRPDIPMISWAGQGVAVEGAHPEVVEAADHVCGSLSGDGVAKHLATIFPELV